MLFLGLGNILMNWMGLLWRWSIIVEWWKGLCVFWRVVNQPMVNWFIRWTYPLISLFLRLVPSCYGWNSVLYNLTLCLRCLWTNSLKRSCISCDIDIRKLVPGLLFKVIDLPITRTLLWSLWVFSSCFIFRLEASSDIILLYWGFLLKTVVRWY